MRSSPEYTDEPAPAKKSHKGEVELTRELNSQTGRRRHRRHDRYACDQRFLNDFKSTPPAHHQNGVREGWQSI